MKKIKIFIPTIGAKLKLAKGWTFDLHDERRNDRFLKAIGHEKLGLGYRYSPGGPKVASEITLPKGTVLTVDRIYIRKGSSDFDSITFNILKGSCPKKPELEKTRFWVKLSDVNKMECEVDELWLED